MAVSMDDAATARKLKASLKAEYPVIGDPRGKIVRAYQVQAPNAAFAQRYTFVIGKDRRVLHVQSGAGAIDPSGAVQACAPPASDAGRR